MFARYIHLHIFTISVGTIISLHVIVYQYHPTSGLKQILHFNWLRCQRTISNSSRVAEFAGFTLILLPNKCFFNLHLATLLLPFLSNQLGDIKTIRPFPLKGHGSIAHSALPGGLLTSGPQGLRVYLLITTHNMTSFQLA